MVRTTRWEGGTSDRLGNGEQELERIPHSLSETAAEPLEDQMGEHLANGASLHILETMSEDDTAEGKEDGRTVRKVGEHESVGDTSMLVEDNEVGDGVGSTGGGEF